MILTFRIENKDQAAADWFGAFIYKLSGKWDYTKKPFSPSRLSFLGKEEDLGVLELDPSFPKFYLFAIPIGIIALFFGNAWLGILANLFSVIYIFWDKGFYLCIMKLGLKKQGSKAKVKLVLYSDFIKEVTFGSSGNL